MTKKLVFFALIFVNILCAENIAESRAESNANSIKNPLDSADSANPPPNSINRRIYKAHLSDISR